MTPSAFWTPGMSAAVRTAEIPTTKLTPTADDARAVPRVPRESASSSVVRASDRPSADTITSASARNASAPRSIGPGASAVTMSATDAKTAPSRTSGQRVPARATVRFRHRNASAMSPNRTARDSTASPSGRLARSSMPQTTPPASVTTRIVALRRSAPRSRCSVTRASPMPKSASVVATSGTGSVPVVMTCASAANIANATASAKQRAATTVANDPLDRTAHLLRPQNVEHHAPRPQMRGDVLGDRMHAHAEDAVMRAAEREHRPGEAAGDLRCHDDERRAPWQPAAFREEHRLGRVGRVRPEPRKDLETAHERPRTTPERRSRTLVRQVVEPVRHEADLTPVAGGLADEIGGRRDDELDRLGIRLDPVLLVRRDVHQEHRVQARGRLVQLGLELAQARGCLPVDLLARIAAAMLAHPAESHRVG